VIPVGTTALRTLESAVSHCKADSISPGTHFSCWKNARASRRRAAEPLRDTARLAGLTHLFIREGYTFKVADGLITNFHVPRSSLLMLVAALVGYRPGLRPVDGRKKILDLYQSALRRGFRFFSFGDGMLIR
jgi:S-adenosylmethionine:tRNA ribosyltransferase-isomerase